MRSLWIIAVIAACGGSDTVSIDEYAETARDAYCRHLVKCSEVESASQCEMLNLDRTFALPASVREAVAKGKMTFSETRAAACLSALADQSCDVTSESNRATPAACQAIFAGALHVEEACAFDNECISQVCKVPSCPDACCLGACVGDTAPGRAKLGESCEDATCAAGSFCDRASLLCTALKPSGSFCGSPNECQYGLDCDQGGQCASLPTLGQSCVDACRDEGTTCGPSGTCVKVGLVGAACRPTTADCSQVLRCDAATRQCSAGVALGQPCTPNQLCAGERAFCDVPEGENRGVCALPKPDGQPCQRSAACDSRYCDPVAQVCAPEPACI